MTKNLTDREVFTLARYAHNKLAPLFAELKKIEPSIHVGIEMVFVDEHSIYPGLGGVHVSVHRAHKDMFVHSGPLRSASDIDALVEQVKADLEKLKTEALAAA